MSSHEEDEHEHEHEHVGVGIGIVGVGGDDVEEDEQEIHVDVDSDSRMSCGSGSDVDMDGGSCYDESETPLRCVKQAGISSRTLPNHMHNIPLCGFRMPSLSSLSDFMAPEKRILYELSQTKGALCG